MALWKEDKCSERNRENFLQSVSRYTRANYWHSKQFKPWVKNTLNLPAEISQGKLLEVALHSQKKLARGNFSRPQERETMQELPQRAKKQLGALRWLRTGSTSSKMNNLLDKAMVRSNFFPQLFIICLFCITNQKFWLFCLFGKTLSCRRLKAYLFNKHQKGFLK